MAAPTAPSTTQNAWLAAVLGIIVAPSGGASATSALPSIPAPGTPAPGTPAPGTPAASAPPPVTPTSEDPALRQIDAALAQLEAKTREYEANGAAAEPLEKALAGFQKRRPALSRPGINPAALKAFLTSVNGALKDLKQDTDRQENAQGAGNDKAVTRLRDTAAGLIAAIEGDARKPLDQRLAKLSTLVDGIEAATDPAKQAALRKQASADAQSLVDDAGAQSGAAGKKQVQEAYKQAIIEKYGITLGGKDGKNVNDDMHYDKIFKTFEMIPVGQSTQSTMKDLSYAPRLDKKSKGGEGIGLFAGKGIQIGKIP